MREMVLLRMMMMIIEVGEGGFEHGDLMVNGVIFTSAWLVLRIWILPWRSGYSHYG